MVSKVKFPANSLLKPLFCRKDTKPQNIVISDLMPLWQKREETLSVYQNVLESVVLTFETSQS